MTTIHSRDEHHRGQAVKPWVKRRRLLLLGGILAVLCPFVVFVTAKYVSDKNYTARIEAIRAQGEPTTIKELVEWQAKTSESPAAEAQNAEPSPPEGKKNVDLYAEAIRLLDSNKNEKAEKDIGDILSRLNKGNLSPEDIEALKAYLAENASVLQMLLEAANLPNGKFPLDYSKGWSIELPHLARLRQAVRLLGAEAVLASLENNPDRMYNALKAGLAVSRPLKQEPILISQLVRFATNGIMLSALSDSLGRTALSQAQLEDLQRLFLQEHHRSGVADAMAAERVWAIEAFDDPSVLSTSSGRNWMDELIPGSYSTLLQTANAFGWFAGDRELYMDCMEDIIGGVQLPYPEARDIFRGVEARVNPNPLLPNLSSILIPAMARIPEAIARDEARLNQGATAAAIERYRWDHGAPPDTLDALEPEYLERAPVDPIDLNPLRYRREGSGYVIYSIGQNGVDDGGVQGENYGEGDTVFQVRR